MLRRLRSFSGAGDGAGLWPDAVARLYGMPADRDGAGQAVGVITLRGGYLPADLDAAAVGANRPRAMVVDHSVDDVVNDFGTDPAADEELALDIQVLAATVPAARIVVYFADNTMDSLAKAIRQAVNDQANRPSVLSISWGSAETFWQEPARNAVQGALEQARDRHVTVVAAAGDELATAGVTDDPDRKAHVGFPGSSPLVLCCGGTHPVLSQGGMSVASETVWNEGRVGTGGGISDVFPVPDFQRHIALPPSVNDGGKRRGVPDVAAAASKSPGYRIVLNGVQVVKDGTSAATSAVGRTDNHDQCGERSADWPDQSISLREPWAVSADPDREQPRGHDRLRRRTWLECLLRPWRAIGCGHHRCAVRHGVIIRSDIVPHHPIAGLVP